MKPLMLIWHFLSCPLLPVHWRCLSGSPSELGPSMALCPPARASVCLGASRLLLPASLCVGESRAKKAKMTEVRGEENRRGVLVNSGLSRPSGGVLQPLPPPLPPGRFFFNRRSVFKGGKDKGGFCVASADRPGHS